MHWTLTRKVGAIAVLYLVLVIGLAIPTFTSTLRTQQLLTYMSHDLLEEVYLVGNYNTHLQRIMTESISYAYTREEEEYDEATETLAVLDEIVMSLETTHHSPGGEYTVHTPSHAIISSDWADLVDSARHIVADLDTLTRADAPRAAAIETGEATEDLEERREALSIEAAAHVTQMRALTTQQQAQQQFITLASVGGSVGGILVLTIVGLWLLEGRIVQPVRRLAQSARAVADGDLEQAVPVTSQDEIGRLQQAFNTMVQQLRHQTHDLEAQYANAAGALQDAEAPATRPRPPANKPPHSWPRSSTSRPSSGTWVCLFCHCPPAHS